MVANPPADLKALWRIGDQRLRRDFGSHRAVSLAADSARTNKDLRELWSRFMQKWVGHIATVIETERARGAAPVTLPAEELSAALNLLNEKVMLSSVRRRRPSVPRERMLETLVHIWVTSIYGDTLIRRRYVRTADRGEGSESGLESSVLDANICSCLGLKPPSCTPTSTRSTHPSSSATTRRCAAGR